MATLGPFPVLRTIMEYDSIWVIADITVGGQTHTAVAVDYDGRSTTYMLVPGPTPDLDDLNVWYQHLNRPTVDLLQVHDDGDTDLRHDVPMRPEWLPARS